jgi:uncharacterized membrane protein
VRRRQALFVIGAVVTFAIGVADLVSGDVVLAVVLFIISAANVVSWSRSRSA